jgi:hypothetical protein
MVTAMKGKITILLLIIILPVISVQAQNVFSFADNGTFEGTGWETELRNFNSSNPNISLLERSTKYHYEGSYSLRVEHKVHSPVTVSYQSVSFNFANTTTSFGLSFRIYIPSDENGLPSHSTLSKIPLEAWSHNTAGGRTRCVPSGYGVAANYVTDTWITINPVLERNIYLYIYPLSTSTKFVYYIDEVRAESSTPVIDGVSFTDTGIELNPSGGTTVLPGNPHPAPAYMINWNDGSTNRVRNDLTPGVIYTATIVNDFGNCDISISNKYIYGRPAPPIVSSASICAGAQLQLTASGAPSGDYYRYTWYDAPINGNLVATGSSVNLGVMSVPGTYKYYAQIDITGSVKGSSSYRSEATATVNPLPAPQLEARSTKIFKGRPATFIALNHQLDYRYSYNFYYGGNQIFEQVNTTEGTLTYTFYEQNGYSDIGIHPVSVTVTGAGECSSNFSYSVEVKDYEPLCETIIPVHSSTSGVITLDNFSGQYVFQRDKACAVDITLGCIQGKVTLPTFSNVVSASAVTYSDEWKYDYMSIAPAATGNAFERGERGKWRTKGTYVFNKGSISVDKNYNSGTYQLSYFNWQRPDATSKTGWLKTSEIQKYTPQGDAVEEKNALGIYSAAKYGYGGVLPYLIAENAAYNSVYFESFENLYAITNTLEEDVSMNGNLRVKAISHSGEYSIQLFNSFTTSKFTLNQQLQSKGLLVRVWVKGGTSPTLKVKLTTEASIYDFTEVARSGEWALMESRIPAGKFGINIGQAFHVAVLRQGNGNMWIDDLRVQPIDAEVVCYVYDVNTLKVSAILDDQHFAMFYQYNGEGKLVRKQVETVRGIKTIQETQYNIPEKDKSSFTGE